MKKYAIVAAAGSGERFHGDGPKQFELLGGRPLLMRVLEAFAQADPEIELILVLPENGLGQWKTLATNANFEIPHQIVVGGSERSESVWKGLELIPEASMVAVHDGARPLINPELINSVFEEAANMGTAIPTLPMNEAVRQINPNGSKGVDRDEYVRVQTPQVFEISLIRRAYKITDHAPFYDEAGRMDAAGIPVHLVPGDIRNIKITTQIDLKFAESLINP